MSTMLLLPQNPRTRPFTALAQQSRPVDARLPEVMPYVLYDTQTYPQAGTAAPLRFFTAVNADKTLSNQEQPGTLPTPQFLDIHRIFLDFLVTPTATVADTAAGAANDIDLILKSARATWTFSQASKVLGPIPATYLGRSGGADPSFGTSRAAAAGAIIQQANGSDNGGFPVNGAITLPPTQSFTFILEFQPTLVPISALMLLRVSFLGLLYRKVG